ncbi:MAG: hypothetical protein ACOC2E_07800 [Bacteroidota bacterium]
MKKTIPWAMTWFMAFMLIFSFNSGAQLFETDFGVSANWTPDDSNTAYETRSYSEDGWTFTGESTIRDNSDTYNGSAHTFRNRGLFTVTNTDAVTGMAGFTIYIRDWSVTADRVVQISTNGGTDFTTVETINSGWFANQDDYFALTHNLASPTDLAANDLVIEISGGDNNSTRMRIGGFVALEEVAAPDPYTELFSALPDYFGVDTERGFAADENSVYVVSRNGGVSVQVHDRLTGDLTGTLNTSTGIAGGTFPANDIEVTDNEIESTAKGVAIQSTESDSEIDVEIKNNTIVEDDVDEYVTLIAGTFLEAENNTITINGNELETNNESEFASQAQTIHVDIGEENEVDEDYTTVYADDQQRFPKDFF